MSRKRIIDTELYFDTDLYGLLGDRGLHLYIRLWGLAEDSGVYVPNYSDIALQLGALKFTSEEVKTLIKNLIKSKKIFVFHENKKEFHWLKNFLKHQTLNNPPPPKLPLPIWLKCELKKFKSGKEYAKYTVNLNELPGIQKASLRITSSLLVTQKRNETNRIETETETETLSPLSPHAVTGHRGNIVAASCKPEGGNGRVADGDVLLGRFDIFKQAYPKWSHGPLTKQHFLEIHPDEELFSKILAGLDILKKSDEWKRESGRFIPSPANFLKDRRWEDRLPKTVTPINQQAYTPFKQTLSDDDVRKFDHARTEGLKKIKEVIKLPLQD